MRRLAAIILSMTVCGGCHSTTPMVNPFTAPATIPPPGTSAPMGQAPYYGGGMQPPIVQPPVGTAPAASPAVPYQPPAGSYQYQGSNRYQQGAGGGVAVLDRDQGVRGAGVWRPSTDTQQSYTVARAATEAQDAYRGTINRAAVESVQEESARLASAVGDFPVARGPVIEHGRSVIRVLEPTEVVQATEPQNAIAPVHYEEPVVVEEGKDFNWSSLDGHLGQTPSEASVRVASYEPRAEETDTHVAMTVVNSRKSQGTFEFDPQYRWVKGQLEYSNIDQQWKLRYIPPDGETDAFGGSVVIEDPTQWGPFAEGDFVVAQGAIVADHPYAQQFSPVYEPDEMWSQLND